MSQVTLNGDNPVTILENYPYVDAGISTPSGGNLTVTSTVNTAVVGTYIVFYEYYKISIEGFAVITIFERRIRTVYVVGDNTAPVLALNGDNTVIVYKGTSYSDPGATSDGGENVTSNTDLNTNSLGTYTTTYSATDVNNNTGTITRIIQVVNENGPVITVNGDNPEIVEKGSTYSEPGASSDGGEQVNTNTNLDTNSLGTYTTIYSSIDANGTTRSSTRTIYVVNANGPIITINGDNPATIEKGSTYSDELATSDGGETVTSTTNLDTSSLGTYTTTYSATDVSGTTGYSTRTIYVVNENGPVITVNGDNPVTIEKDSIYGDAWATSDGGETVTSTTNLDITTAGMYIINYSATDQNGTIGTARRLAIVVDTTEPGITLIGKNPGTIERGSIYTDAGATANGGETVTSYSNIDTSKVGRYTVTYTATDTNGNTGTAIRTVDVDVLDGTFAPIDFSQYVNPNKNENNISGELIGKDGEVYYREYSFIDRAFDYDTIKQQQLDEHVETLKHENKEDRDTKAQIYANKVRGKWIHRTTSCASQGNANTITNPNTKNYLRIDANDKIINEKYEQPIPNINTPLPYMNQVNSETIYTSNNILDVSYNSPKKDKSTIVIPIVKNDDLPVEQEIVKGGILYAGTNFNKADDREKLEPNLYKFSEQAIVSSEFADKFNIDIENTYDKAELEEITGKTLLELYPDYPSWEKNKFHGSVYFSQPDNGNAGDFLPSMYSATNYVYDNVNNQYANMVITINMFAPVGDNVNEANDGNGTRVSQNTKYSIVRI